MKFYYKVLSSSAGDHLLVIRIDRLQASIDSMYDINNNINDVDCLNLRVWQLNDRNPEHHWPMHWMELENDSNLCKSYPFYAVNFPPVIERA